MAYIKTISDLPKWFDISNYRTEHRSAEKLLEQIIYRKAFLDFLVNEKALFPIDVEPDESFFSFSLCFGSVPCINAKNIKFIKRNEIDENSDQYSKLESIFEYAFNKIKFDPLNKDGFGEIKYDYEFSWLYYFKDFIDDYLQYDYAPIKDVQLYEIGEKFSMIHSGLAKYLLCDFREEFTEIGAYRKIKNYYDSIGEGHLFDNFEYSNEPDELYEMGKEYVESLSTEDCLEFDHEASKPFLNYEREVQELNNPLGVKPLISVDLSCSDAVIREQFNQWLIKQRSSLHEIASKNEIDLEIDGSVKSRQFVLDKYYSYNILAYMDLLFWSVFTDSKIKLSVFAHALFPYGEYDAEFIRKILKPLVGKLFQPSSKEVLELMYLKNMENF